MASLVSTLSVTNFNCYSLTHIYLTTLLLLVFPIVLRKISFILTTHKQTNTHSHISIILTPHKQTNTHTHTHTSIYIYAKFINLWRPVFQMRNRFSLILYFIFACLAKIHKLCTVLIPMNCDIGSISQYIP